MTISKPQPVPVIAIDGPSGSGKGTIGLLLAHKLGHWNFLDSGAVYRGLALAVLQSAISLDDVESVRGLAENIKIEFQVPGSDSLSLLTLLNGEDVSAAIRTEECGKVASKIAHYPAVREALLQLQREFKQKPGLVADGRDMGTVVFPDAMLKVFLTASCEERAKRRFKQLQDRKIHASLLTILQDLRERDQRDVARVTAPLRPAEDAKIIDTTKLGIDEVVETILGNVK